MHGDPGRNQNRNIFIHLPSIEGYEKIEIDDNYLIVLHEILKNGKPTNLHFHCHGADVQPKVKSFFKNYRIDPVVTQSDINDRSGNVMLKHPTFIQRKRGLLDVQD